MSTEKTFTVTGTSILNGECKVRFANDTTRVKVLEKNGHTDVHLIELETPMTKLEAAEFLLTDKRFEDELAQTTIAEFIANATGNTKPKVEMKKATKPKTKIVEAKTEITEEEIIFEAPFEHVEAEPMPKTIDTVTEEEWAVLEAVTTDKF